jgi:two-component system response regulator (stage 0 sporulation protein F)
MSSDLQTARENLKRSIIKLARVPLFLIADDSIEDCDLLSHMLKRLSESSQILVCHDGDSAMKLMQKHSIDVLFLDVKMPGMNGVQIMNEMKRLGIRTMLVIVTGFNGETELAMEVMRLGAVKVIVKPVTLDNLKDTFDTI